MPLPTPLGSKRWHQGHLDPHHQLERWAEYIPCFMFFSKKNYIEWWSSNCAHPGITLAELFMAPGTLLCSWLSSCSHCRLPEMGDFQCQGYSCDTSLWSQEMEHRIASSVLIHLTDQAHVSLLSTINKVLVLRKKSCAPVLKSHPSEMAPCRIMFYFGFTLFFILAHLPSGKLN